MRLINDRLAKLQFWWARKTIKYDRDYRVLTGDPAIIVVELLAKPYAGVKVEFKNFTIGENSDGTGSLNFETVIVENPTDLNLKTNKFAKLVTNIVRLIIDDAVRMEKHESRELDSEEPDDERNIREEDPPVRQARVSKRKSRKETVRKDT